MTIWEGQDPALFSICSVQKAGCISYFYCCCDQIPKKKKLSRGSAEVVFVQAHSLWDTVYHDGEGMTQRVKPLAIVSIVRKRQAGIGDTLYDFKVCP